MCQVTITFDKLDPYSKEARKARGLFDHARAGEELVINGLQLFVLSGSHEQHFYEVGQPPKESIEIVCLIKKERYR